MLHILIWNRISSSKLRLTTFKKIEDRWRIEYKKDNQNEQQIFDFVIVATGIFSKKNLPKILGSESFTGEIIHSSDYKSPRHFKDKNVLVMGGAYSGAEISANISCVLKKFLIQLLEIFWIIGREIPSQPSGRLLPVDLAFYKRNTRVKPGEITLKTSEDYKKE